MYYHRTLEEGLASKISHSKIKILLGARQTGKSTLLSQVAGDDALVIDLQDSSRRLEYERRPKAFSEMLLAREERPLKVIVDEIQKVPSLLDEIQWLFDHHRNRFDFFITGSSARRLASRSSNLLPGRSHLFHLYPITQWERSGQTCHLLPPPQKTKKNSFPKQPLEDFLITGTLPGILLEPSSSRTKSLEGYVGLYLEEEIRREGLVKDVGSFSRFLELAAMESGKVMNLTKLSNESGVPLATIKPYYQVLTDTFVGYWLDPYIKNTRKRLLTTPRFYFFDLGVRNKAARLPLDASLLKTQGGILLEHWVALELLHRTSTLGREFSVFFWRTVGGAEIDFILETPDEIIPIEVKWTDRPTPQDARHLGPFMKTHPHKTHRGFVVCRVPERRELAPGIFAIPWWEL